MSRAPFTVDTQHWNPNFLFFYVGAHSPVACAMRRVIKRHTHNMAAKKSTKPPTKKTPKRPSATTRTRASPRAPRVRKAYTPRTSRKRCLELGVPYEMHRGCGPDAPRKKWRCRSNSDGDCRPQYGHARFHTCPGQTKSPGHRNFTGRVVILLPVGVSSMQRSRQRTW